MSEELPISTAEARQALGCHRMTETDAGPRQAAGGGDAEAVKAGSGFAVADAGLEEDPVPNGGSGGHLGVSAGASFSLQLAKERDEVWVQRGGEKFASLGAERDDSVLQVDVFHGVDVGFTEATGVFGQSVTRVTIWLAKGMHHV